MATEPTPPIELTDEEVAEVLDTVAAGDVLPCSGHSWPGPHNRTTPVVVVRREGERDRQLSLRPILWRLTHGEAPGRPVFSMHAPPCCEHLTLNRAQANSASAEVESPELFPAEPAVEQSQEGQAQQPAEPHAEAHEAHESTAPALSAAEPPTSTVEPMSLDEPQDAPYGGGPGADRGSAGPHPWQLAERRRTPLNHRTAALLAAVAIIGLLWPAGCRVLARSDDDAPDRPGTATTEPTATPPPSTEAPPTTKAATTTAWTAATMPEPCTPSHCPSLDD